MRAEIPLYYIIESLKRWMSAKLSHSLLLQYFKHFSRIYLTRILVVYLSCCIINKFGAHWKHMSMSMTLAIRCRSADKMRMTLRWCLSSTNLIKMWWINDVWASYDESVTFEIVLNIRMGDKEGRRRIDTYCARLIEYLIRTNTNSILTHRILIEVFFLSSLLLLLFSFMPTFQIGWPPQVF